MVDKFREECGVFGLYGNLEAAKLTYLGLYALQHRGQESAGIASADGVQIRVSKAMGYVNEAFDDDTIAKLPGPLAIGHVRYSTAGESRLANAQPIVVDSAHGQLAVAHNGNLVNALEVRDSLVREGAIFQTNSDTEVIVHLFARAKVDGAENAIIEAISQVRGAFSLVMMTKDRLIGVRDPHGFRPLALGRLGDAWVICSETCAMDLIGATYVRDVEPGEVVIAGPHGLKSVKPYPPARQSQCVFEHVYFSRPDSYVFGESVNEVRTEFGRRLARESGVPADVVVPIPDSGVCAAVGYAEAAGLPMRMGLIRNHYVGRTFIQPQQSIRHFGVRVKLNPVRSILEGRRVVLVDDSIVRGTTSRKIVRMVRSAGAREVHMRISCPPTVSPCFYGVDTPRRSELIAATHTLEEIRKYVDADSVAYLSLEGLTGAVRGGSSSYCTSCYTGIYPVAFPRDEAKYLQLALKLNPGPAAPVAEPDHAALSFEKDTVVS
ncbi:MAG TPA: amidophosphoribosyltransferase [Vicinamibacterales bacterium]|jgi:amidophosphoribosyltransferase|nr:amidophosphoribosyltransferase [Vicinamibacterales bacterium]